MYPYYHDDSGVQVPFVTRTIQAHRVLQSLEETQATSINRDFNDDWGTRGLGLDDIDAESASTGGQTTITNVQPR